MYAVISHTVELVLESGVIAKHRLNSKQSALLIAVLCYDFRPADLPPTPAEIEEIQNLRHQMSISAQQAERDIELGIKYK